MKFFPVYDGGCLVSAKGIAKAPAPRRGGAGFQLKALLNVLERSHAYGRLPLDPLWNLAFFGKERLLRAAKSVRGAGAVVAAPGSVDGGYAFENAWMDVEMSWSSTGLLGLLSAERCVDARRVNYTRLLAKPRRRSGWARASSRATVDGGPVRVSVLRREPRVRFSFLEAARSAAPALGGCGNDDLSGQRIVFSASPARTLPPGARCGRRELDLDADKRGSCIRADHSARSSVERSKLKP